MLNITATIEGTPIPLENRNDLEALYRFIGTYLRWTTPQPTQPLSRQPTSVQPQPASTIPAGAVRTQNTVRPNVSQQLQSSMDIPTQVDKRPFEGRNPPEGERIIDYIVKVLEQHPPGLSSSQIAAKMVEAGWKTDSGNPLRLVQVKLYQDKEQFVHMVSGKWILRKFLSQIVKHSEDRPRLDEETEPLEPTSS